MELLAVLVGLLLVALTGLALLRMPEPGRLAALALTLGAGGRRWALLFVCLAALVLIGVAGAGPQGHQFSLLVAAAVLLLPGLALAWALGRSAGSSR